jgi:hypothetical protein
VIRVAKKKKKKKRCVNNETLKCIRIYHALDDSIRKKTSPLSPLYTRSIPFSLGMNIIFSNVSIYIIYIGLEIYAQRMSFVEKSVYSACSGPFNISMCDSLFTWSRIAPLIGQPLPNFFKSDSPALFFFFAFLVTKSIASVHHVVYTF